MPTNCGRMVERRDQIFTTSRRPDERAASAFFRRKPSMNGPFFSERVIDYPCCFPLRDRTMNFVVRLFLRVLAPLVGLPHGVTGWRPPLVRPSPPPCGWSIGFMAVPRTEGRLPFQTLRPALAMISFIWSGLETAPTVAMQV